MLKEVKLFTEVPRLYSVSLLFALVSIMYKELNMLMLSTIRVGICLLVIVKFCKVDTAKNPGDCGTKVVTLG